MIGKIPVYVGLRSGNAPANFRQIECLKACLNLLRKYNITVDRIRIDGAGYQNDLMDYLDNEKIKFNIGADISTRAAELMQNAKNWRKLEFKTAKHIWDAELASADFQLYKHDSIYFMNVMRVKATEGKKQPAKWKLYDGYYYKFLITNDPDIAPHKLFEEYHQRGTSEKVFDELKNDFGWRILPFSKMDENLVYLQFTAFTSIIYQSLLQNFCKIIDKIKPTMRLRRFKKHFLKAFAFAVAEGVFTFYGADLDFKKLV